MSKAPIHPGEWFLRVGNPPSKWRVERIIEYPDLPPHARLVRYDFDPAMITVALSVLIDKHHFIRLPDQAL